MDTENLADVLYAFISRLPHGAMQTLADADEECWRASAHLGMNAQLKSQEELRCHVFNAVQGIAEHDRQRIVDVVNTAAQLQTVEAKLKEVEHADQLEDFVWPSDQARSDSYELDRVCDHLELVLDRLKEVNNG